MLGPTASGKSALATEIARRIGGEVVNGDPFQAYRDLPVGTGQPSPAEQGGIPHHGYGLLPLETALNPASFGELARGWIAACPNPVLVTGSGLYLRGIWDQLTQLPDVPGDVTAKLRRWVDLLGSPALHRYLAAVDPVRAAQLHPNDRSRVQRALGLHLATGGRASRFLDGVERGVPEGWRAILVMPSRDRQRDRVAARVRQMIRAGWQKEVAVLQGTPAEAHLRRLRPLGYETWMDEPRGAGARIILDTRAYAKRQGTYFRNQWPEIPAWDPDAEPVEAAFGKLGI